MPAAPQQVGLPPRYRTVRHIADGGMASVWAAQDTVLERLVAVKVLAPGYAADPAARRRFTREARAAARVSDHPHVVTIFDTGEHDGAAFIVMELRAGGSLADRLRGGDAVPTPTAVRWLGEAASALDAAHRAGIVHRDVKPGNLLLDEHGRMAVGDFGIASLADDTSVTQAGQVLGTAAYLSPEQALGEPATPASDRYSLAVVAYELLCGRKPFGGDTPVAQARAHAEVDPPAPTGPCRAAAATLRRGLAKDPAQRPATAIAFVDELRAALGAATAPRTRVLAATTARERRGGRDRAAAARTPVPVPAAAHATAVPGPWAPAYARPRRRGSGALVVGGLAALALAGGAAALALTLTDGDDGSGGRHTPLTAVRGVNAASRSGGASAGARGRGAKSGSRAAHGHDHGPHGHGAHGHGAHAHGAHAHGAHGDERSEGAGPAAGAALGGAPERAGSSTDPRSPSELNDTGYALLPGDPEHAVPLLRESVAKYRGEGDTTSLGYAYALYNLGHALRLAGRPAEAIPYLQERLRVSSNQRGVVERELEVAEQQVAAQGA